LSDNPSLDAGLHLNLTEGKPVSHYERIPSLAGPIGFLYHHPFELLIGILRRRVSETDLQREIGAQVEKALKSGVAISHIDGHKHVHVLPHVFRLICKIGPGYGITAVRSTMERTPKLLLLVARNLGSAHRILKQYVFSKVLCAGFARATSYGQSPFTSPCRFYGITQTGYLDITAFADILNQLEDGVSEVMCHPGYVDEDLRRTPTRLHHQREHELELLTGREIRDLLSQAGIALTSYRDLGDCASHA
jgi:predicted glycoside hydrolase/deacetylase ChbG (UPF0249 family)